MGRKSRRKHEPLPSTPVVATVEAVKPFDPRVAIGVSIALLILVAIVYAQVRSHEFLNFDDQLYVTSNSHVKGGLTGAGIAWALRSLENTWHPLTWMSLMLDVQLFGVTSSAMHLVNVAFHAANSILLFLLLVRLTAMPWRSAIVAAIFAVHPMHVESVAWLVERKDVLSTLFYLLAIWFYADYVRRRSRLAYAGVVVAFALGLMAKGTLVTLPFLLLLIDYWPLERREPIARLIIEKIPLFALTIGGSIMSLLGQRQVGAIVNKQQISFPVRAANSAIAYISYIAKTLWPENLIVPYEYGLNVSPALAIFSLLAMIAISAAVVRYRAHRALFTGWFWFAGTLVPMIGLVQIGPQWKADRYMYFPMIGLTIAVVWLVAEVMPSRVGAAIAGAAVVVFTAAAYAQTGYWATTESLFRHTLRIDPTNTFALKGLGNEYLLRGEYREAAQAFQRAVQLRPSNDDSHAQFGKALAALGDANGAVAELKRAIELNPNNDDALFELGRLDLMLGQTAEAQALLQRAKAINLTPRTLGTLALARNDLQTARREFERAVAEDPQSSEARNNLASLLARLGDDQRALEQYQEAIRLDPASYDAHMNLGALLSRSNHNAEAATEFEAAAKVRPASPEPLVFRAMLLANERQFGEAAAAAERAIRINHDLSNAIFTNAARLAPKPTNIDEFAAALRAQSQR